MGKKKDVVQRVVLNIDGKEVSLSLADAQDLYEGLRQLFSPAQYYYVHPNTGTWIYPYTNGGRWATSGTVTTSGTATNGTGNVTAAYASDCIDNTMPTGAKIVQ